MITNVRLSYFMVLLLTVSGSVLADNTKGGKKDYKCYLQTTSGHQIAFYEWKEKEVALRMAKLPARKVPSKGVGKKAYIKDVEECVELDQEFTLGAAQKLDDITLK
ncbi:TapY2 family type IVa secretion system protein [Shewanella sp. UCD-KL12]|uniref:TapY2 family type IVa secretion system protein n=1 Tax=Shewanella sp. UCD-KL12 TaxID=1917163 RepID=UPI000971118B|nr:TapY2 family type IVa secretion system protein [Shewanella sp. UCD-KL12]